MGDRIVIRITDGDRRSPDLYCHWAGLRAVKAVHDALGESRRDIHNLICNVVVKVMCGECSDASYYLYNSGEAEGMADWDNWTWTFDLPSMMWRSTMPQLEGRLLTMSEADDFVRDVWPCLYSDCPCDGFDMPTGGGKPRYSDTIHSTREGCRMERTLTRQEMILLHLLRYANVIPNGYTMPAAMTQDGIGLAVGMTRSHVSTVVGIMADKGMVAGMPTHPKGASTRKRAYYLLPPGVEKAKDLSACLEDENLTLEDIVGRPKGNGNSSPNVVRAMSEIQKASNAVQALMDEGDPAKIRAAIEHASVAIGCLSREVA